MNRKLNTNCKDRKKRNLHQTKKNSQVKSKKGSSRRNSSPLENNRFRKPNSGKDLNSSNFSKPKICLNLKYPINLIIKPSTIYDDHFLSEAQWRLLFEKVNNYNKFNTSENYNLFKNGESMTNLKKSFLHQKLSIKLN